MTRVYLPTTSTWWSENNKAHMDHWLLADLLRRDDAEREKGMRS